MFFQDMDLIVHLEAVLVVVVTAVAGDVQLETFPPETILNLVYRFKVVW
jgi:hypothetical protein